MRLVKGATKQTNKKHFISAQKMKEEFGGRGFVVVNINHILPVMIPG